MTTDIDAFQTSSSTGSGRPLLEAFSLLISLTTLDIAGAVLHRRSARLQTLRLRLLAPRGLRPDLVRLRLRHSFACKGLGHEVSKCQRRSKSDPGADVVTRHRRVHIVAAGVEALDRPVVLIEDFPVRPGHEAPAGPKVARLQLDRIKGRPLDGPKAGVRLVSGIALVCVIPSALTGDRLCPGAPGDGGNALGHLHELVPRALAGIEDRLIGVPNTVAEKIGTQILPDVLDGVQFG
jgi:hypothetical protein